MFMSAMTLRRVVTADGDGPRCGRDVVEHAVDPVADPEVLARGLDVDVRGPLVEGLEDQQVHVADDRGVVDDGLDVAEALVAECPRSPTPPPWRPRWRRHPGGTPGRCRC